MSELQAAEAGLRRGIGYALLIALGFVAVVLMLVVAIGMVG